MAPSGLLKGKWCFITGGGKGIGKAIAETFAAEGGNIALVARSKDSLEEAAKICKEKGAPEVETLSCDLMDSASLNETVKKFMSSHKHCDVLVNCAGMMGSGSPTEGDDSQWQACIALNLLAPMFLTKAFAPSMVEKKEGIIINICSIAGLEPMKATPVYAASKWGLRGWSLSCYEALRLEKVKVVAIHPAAVATPMTESMFNHDKCIQPADVAEAAMLVLRCSPACVPSEITLRLTESAAK